MHAFDFDEFDTLGVGPGRRGQAVAGLAGVGPSRVDEQRARWTTETSAPGCNLYFFRRSAGMTTQPFSETVTDVGPPPRYTIRHECITPLHIGARADCAGEGRLAPRRVFDGVLMAGRDHPGRETMTGSVEADRIA